MMFANELGSHIWDQFFAFMLLIVLVHRAKQLLLLLRVSMLPYRLPTRLSLDLLDARWPYVRVRIPLGLSLAILSWREDSLEVRGQVWSTLVICSCHYSSSGSVMIMSMLVTVSIFVHDERWICAGLFGRFQPLINLNLFMSVSLEPVYTIQRSLVSAHAMGIRSATWFDPFSL